MPKKEANEADVLQKETERLAEIANFPLDGIVSKLVAVIKGMWEPAQMKAIILFAQLAFKIHHYEIAEKCGVSHDTITKWKRSIVLDKEGKNVYFWEDVKRVAACFYEEADVVLDKMVLRDAQLNPKDNPQLQGIIIASRNLYFGKRTKIEGGVASFGINYNITVSEDKGDGEEIPSTAPGRDVESAGNEGGEEAGGEGVETLGEAGDDDGGVSCD